MRFYRLKPRIKVIAMRHWDRHSTDVHLACPYLIMILVCFLHNFAAREQQQQQQQQQRRRSARMLKNVAIGERWKSINYIRNSSTCIVLE
ncbi:hypothetical protein PoB_004551700 [Plakobranchus ocellatus]|uniref:Secreted protein n=1 Tax=Plakobranchus ocellatus TaxID=259542 RepID=A0AAV4BI43_9GAST|nr:hypothetical protein PoB_004551700 [Plakobranchus ocellatus]